MEDSRLASHFFVEFMLCVHPLRQTLLFSVAAAAASSTAAALVGVKVEKMVSLAAAVV